MMFNFFSSIGIVLTIYAIRGIYLTFRKTKTWIKTSGEVVGFNPNWEGTKYPVIKFSNERGWEQKATQHMWVFPGYQIGKVLPIYYNPQKSSEIFIANFRHKYFGYCFVLFLGLAFIIAGFAASGVAWNAGGWSGVD
jgi:hypothetical protein